MDGYRTMTENAGSKISCQDVSPPKGFEMKNRPKPRVRPVDYHLECCIVARFRKTAKGSASKLSCQYPSSAKRAADCIYAMEFLHFSKPLAPIAFACVQNYFLRHCAFMTVTNLFRISIFLPFSLRWRKVGK